MYIGLLTWYNILISTNSIVKAWLQYSGSHSVCSNDEPFLTLWNTPIQNCILQCRIRKLCLSVNYWNRKLKCELMSTDTGSTVIQDDITQPCVYISMTSVHHIHGVFAACNYCDAGTVCDTEAGSCNVRECPKVQVAHATVQGNVFSVGARLNIECDAYYDLDDSTLQPICLNNGNWSSVPNCVHIGCGNPPVVTNAVIDAGDTSLNAVRVYSCQSTAVLLYPASAVTSTTCLLTGFWSSTNFQCVIDCGEPVTAISHAVISNGGTLSGDSRSYSCASGYLMRNLVDSVISCNSGGSWSTARFDCLRNCNDPPGITNANLCSGDTVEGSVREYQCEQCYIAINVISMFVTCNTDGEWSNAQFRCVKTCGSLPSVSHATVVNGDDTEGAVRYYTCDVGYTAIDVVSMYVTCQADGHWSAVQFECVIECSDPPYVSNAVVASGSNQKCSSRVYTCVTGYVSTNDNAMSITCQSSGDWSSPQFNCITLTCPNNWHQIDDSCYYVASSTMTVSDAKSYCHNQQGYLFEPETVYEYNQVKSYIVEAYGNKQFFLGLTDENSEGTWKFMETGVPVSYTLWNPNEPDYSTTHNYVVIWAPSNWADIPGYNGYTPVCEKSLS